MSFIKIGKKLLIFVLVLVMVLSVLPVAQAAETFETEPMVAASHFHSVALKRDGTVFGWGYNSNLPEQVVGLTNVTAAATADGFSLALKSDGTVWSWAWRFDTDTNVPEQVTGLTDVIKISARAGNSLALKSDGTVWAWGDNRYGQLGNGTTNDSKVPVQVKGLTDVISIASGDKFSVAARSDGTVLAWGDNSDYQLGNSQITKLSAVAVQVTELTDIVSVSSGNYFSTALKSDGTVWAWGWNRYSQLGSSGTGEYSSVPLKVTDLTDVNTISAGGTHSLAIKNDGTLWAWGWNYCCQLGTNSDSESESVPVQVTEVSDVFSIAAGDYHSLVMKSDGTVWAWGDNSLGMFGNGISNNSSSESIDDFSAIPVQVLGVNGEGYLNLYETDETPPDEDETPPDEDETQIAFADIAQGDWFYDAVQYVAEKGIMVGKSETKFEPNDILSRAMVATVLYRMAGSPGVTYSNIFTDVPSEEWYSDAIVWAFENNIVEGYGANKFGTNDSITREQFATMIYRFAGYKGYNTDYSEDLSGFKDASKVSSWAINAMRWNVENELITGMTNTTLEPYSTATRAQCATILMRFTQNFS